MMEDKRTFIGSSFDDFLAEEGSIGGFGSHVLHHLATSGLLELGCKVRPMFLPDVYQDHDSPVKQYEEAGLQARNIVDTALKALGVEGMAAARA